jgi:hypothetical protein
MFALSYHFEELPLISRELNGATIHTGLVDGVVEVQYDHLGNWTLHEVQLSFTQRPALDAGFHQVFGAQLTLVHVALVKWLHTEIDELVSEALDELAPAFAIGSSYYAD